MNKGTFIFCRPDLLIRVISCFAAILIALPLHSQEVDGISADLASGLLNYTKRMPWEDVYLHTDRTEYIAGENLWFNAYLTDRQTGLPVSNSKILYVEILNPVHKPVVQSRISIDEGCGPGNLLLPDSLTTGRYLIRAYTNRMKNFLPECCFMREITIFNTLKDNILTNISLSRNQALSKAVTTSDFELLTNNLIADSVEIIINTEDIFRLRNNNLCYLLIQTRGNIDRLSQVRLSTNKSILMVPKSSLSPGVNQIIVFNSLGKPVAERYIYTPQKLRNTIQVKDPVSIARREKLALEVELEKDIAALSKSAHISLSVTPFTGTAECPDISDYLVFGSEFGLLPELLRNNKLSALSAGSIDSCLQSLKSHWIEWDRITSDQIPLIKYQKEEEFHFLSGRLEYDGENAGPNKYMLLSTPGKDASFQYCITDKEGVFTFMIPVNGSVSDMVIQPLEVDNKPVISMGSSFSESYLYSQNFPAYPEVTIPAYISKWSSNYQVGKIYGSTYLNIPQKVVFSESDKIRFYGKPDIELVMDDYIKLPVMQEVFFELVPGVFLRNQKSKYTIRIADAVTNRLYEEPPVIMVDGVVIDDVSVIANLDPELVEKIDAVKGRYLIGDFIFYGIVNVITRAGDLSDITLPGYAVRLSYNVTDPVNSFSAPDYNTPLMKLSRIPDFRNTLYWNPTLKPDKDGRVIAEFWSSDMVSDYIIDIQGISDSGQVISVRKSLKIR